MIAKFIKACTLKSIRIKLWLIYFLNLTDVIFTIFLINTGYFTETNLIMKNVINNSIISISIKGLVPLFLIVILCLRIKKASTRQLYLSNILVMICFLCYTVVNMSHILWTILYLHWT